MRRAVALVATVLLLATVPSAAAARTTLAELRGPWGGSLAGVSPRIDVTVRLSGGQKGSTIAFAGGIDCSGVLVYGGRSGDRLTFTERITASATSRCGGLGVVRLRLRPDGALRYQWQDIHRTIPPSTAVLQRLILGG